jgi:hypothetical protein
MKNKGNLVDAKYLPMTKTSTGNYLAFTLFVAVIITMAAMLVVTNMAIQEYVFSHMGAGQ